MAVYWLASLSVIVCFLLCWPGLLLATGYSTGPPDKRERTQAFFHAQNYPLSVTRYIGQSSVIFVFCQCVVPGQVLQYSSLGFRPQLMVLMVNCLSPQVLLLESICLPWISLRGSPVPVNPQHQQQEPDALPETNASGEFFNKKIEEVEAELHFATRRKTRAATGEMG